MNMAEAPHLTSKTPSSSYYLRTQVYLTENGLSMLRPAGSKMIAPCQVDRGKIKNVFRTAIASWW